MSCNDKNENTLISELKLLYTPSHYIGELSGYHDNKESSLDLKASEFLNNRCYYISIIISAQLKTLDEVIDMFQLKYYQKLSEPSADVCEDQIFYCLFSLYNVECSTPLLGQREYK